MELKGHIYWVNDDFKYSGESERKLSDQFHCTAVVQNVIVNDKLIYFDVPEYFSNGNLCTYKVALNVVGNNSFKGTYEEVRMNDTGPVTCNSFINHKQIMLYGEWIEYGKLYTWWAIIDKGQD